MTCRICGAWLLQYRELQEYLKCVSCGWCCMKREKSMSILKEELLKGRNIQFASEYTEEISQNLDNLLISLNKIRDAWGNPMVVNSGWRPLEINNTIKGAAVHSKHMIGLAADINDPDGSLWRWVINNLQLMKDLNIFMEDKRWTDGWVHFQLGEPVSGHRIFIPNNTPAIAVNLWDGIYDKKKFDNI